MYGPGPGPATPQPKPADPTVAVVLRVIFTVLPVITIGFLTWGSMLYLAVVRRRTADWVLVAVSVALLVFSLVFIEAADNSDDPRSDFGATLLLICMFGGAVYFLVADILRYRAARQAWGGYPRPQPRPNPNPYATGFGGGPMAAPPYQGYPVGRQYSGPAVGPAPIPNVPNVPNTPADRAASTPPPSRPATPPPSTTPRPTPPPAPRIDQVRAELDELSDYLRKERQDGQDGGGGEGAR